MSEAHPPVLELIRQREQLTGWIAKLDEVGEQANSRVAERVRADYQDRLARVNEALGSHRDEIEADLERFRGELAEAEARRGGAGEALEEARLRHLIGELTDDAWEETRPALERDVAVADEAVAHARAEVERLEALSADIRSAADAPAEMEVVWVPEAEAPAAPEAPASAPEPDAPEAEAPEQPDAAPSPAAEDTVEAPGGAPAPDARAEAEEASADQWDPFGGEFGGEEKQGDAGEDLPWLAGIDDAAKGWAPPAEDSGLEFLRGIDEPPAAPAPGAEPAADLGADDLAFLEELDRSIGGSGAKPPAAGAEQPPAPPAESAAAPASRAEPLLCKECGAINEPHAWYCEICGSEL